MSANVIYPSGHDGMGVVKTPTGHEFVVRVACEHWSIDGGPDCRFKCGERENPAARAAAKATS